MEFLRDSCDSVDDLNVGDEIEVSYRLSGRRWQRDAQSEAKYFLAGGDVFSITELDRGNDDRESQFPQ